MKILTLARTPLSWAITAVAILVVALGLVASQAIATAMTVTAEPLQNPTADGSLKYLSDYSGASAVVTRHESTDLTLNVSDQVTTVTVQGTKASGVADVTVELKDTAGTVWAGVQAGSGEPGPRVVSFQITATAKGASSDDADEDADEGDGE